MNRQLTLDNFFKGKISSFTMQKASKKKFNLSLSKKTPTKSPKLNLNSKNVPSVIDLISDDEDITTPQDKSARDSNSSASDITIIYTPKSKSPQTPSSSFSSPSSKPKFYSPNKKRSVTLRTPNKVRRNLQYTLSKCADDIFQEKDFLEYSCGFDDSTTFLLRNIYQFLKDDSLQLLLKESSIELLKNSMKAKKPGMRLVCRLYWRQEGWYRWEQVQKILSGKESVNEPTLHDALNSLIEYGLITMSNIRGPANNLSFDSLVKMLKLDELKEICKDLKLKIANKDDAVQSLKQFCNQKSNITSYFKGCKSTNEERVLKMLNQKVGTCYKISELARDTLDRLYILMYLGMDYGIIRERKLELMLINIKSNREAYPVSKDLTVDTASVVFKDREEFDRYMFAFTTNEAFLATTELTERLNLIENVFALYKAIDNEEMVRYKTLPKWLRRFTPAYIYVKILESGIQDLKKNKDEENMKLALDILSTLIDQNTFRQHKKAEWYSEKALILDKMLRQEEAALVLLEGFKASLPEEELDVLRPRALKLAGRKTHAVSEPLQCSLRASAEDQSILEKNFKATHIEKHHKEITGRGKKKFEIRTPGGIEMLDAEEYCIRYYTTEGDFTHGGHWEGKMVTTIFFLLFWDIIYANLRGVRGIFLSRYQMYPLDMFYDSFYENRQTLIEDRLREIEAFSVEQMIAKMYSVWESRPECELSGLRRDVGWDCVRAVSAALGPRRAAAVCARLCAFRHTSGFPDLTLWNVYTDQVAFVEVKTDADKPSLRQLQWMRYLQRHGVRTEFCYVGVDTTRNRARSRPEHTTTDASDQ